MMVDRHQMERICSPHPVELSRDEFEWEIQLIRVIQAKFE